MWHRMDRLTKVDNTADEDKGLVAIINLPEGHVGGEFVMVTRNPPSTALSKAEDDGWLVGFVTDTTTMKSYCLVRCCHQSFSVRCIYGATHSPRISEFVWGCIIDTHNDNLSRWPQVYDAKTMDEKPVAKVALPQRVPLGFHSTFVYSEQIKLQDTVHN